MKINEIFGFGSKKPTGVQPTDWSVVKQDIARRITKWNDHISAMGSDASMPDVYQSNLRDWAEKMFPKASSDVLDAVAAVNPQKPQTAANYIRDVYISDMNADTAAGFIKKTPRGTPAPVQPAAPAPTGPRLHPDVKVVATTPNIVLRYGKQDFALNNADQWVRFGTTKPATAEMAAFLNKQLQAL